MHLVDHARVHIENTFRRPFFDRSLRGLLAALLPYPGRFRAALIAGFLAKPLAPLFAAVGLASVAAMLRLSRLPARSSLPRQRIYPPAGRRKGRVALLAGCANKVLKPSINDATIRLLNRLGIEVVIADGEGCCGSLVHHMGREAQAHAQAKANIDAWIAEMDAGGSTPSSSTCRGAERR
jgi:glycolate oxidase iron-sulfur subunit